jgi:hypothetical protein
MKPVPLEVTMMKIIGELKAERVHDLNQIGGLQEEVARLKAEVERLEHQVNYWRIEAEVDNARWLRCLQDLEELRASSFVTAVPSHQYERVIKAGDAMASSIQFNEEMSQDYNGPTIVHQSVQRWNAAKEGKQS